MKYRNKKITVNGMNFDSKKEHRRYEHLCQLQTSGLISDLHTQVAFELVGGVKIAGEARKRPCVRYVADFVYLDRQTGKQVVEDVKSPITRKDKVYRLKKHLMKVVHDIDVVEV